VEGGDAFEDVLAANEEYARRFALAGLSGRPARGLAVVTCIDTRIEPLAQLGLSPGDAKILRNAGGRVDLEVLKTLLVAHRLLGVTRVVVVGHTDCRMGVESEDELHSELERHGSPATHSLSFAVGAGLEATVRRDVLRVRAFPYLDGLVAGGFIYDVETGLLSRVC